MPPAIETLSIKTTTSSGTVALGSTKAALGDRLGQVINVKTDFGAVGDGSHNDGPNIQAAFDAAFGPAGSPHGNTNRFQNVPVYFPAGNYAVGSPLYLTNIVGGWIFGEGQYATRIFYTGSLSGNSVVLAGPGSEITPLFMGNGIKYLKFENLSLSITGTNSVGLWVFQNSFESTDNTFNDLLIENVGAAGILAGYGGSGAECSECVYNNVTFSACAWGLRVASANALNHAVFGGGGNGCTIAVYSQNSGSISPICDASLAGNALDFQLHGGVPVSIIGGRTESTNCLTSDDTQVHMSGFLYQAGTPGTIVNLAGGGSVVMDACNSTPGAGAYVIAALSSNGLAILDRFVSSSGSNGTISGSAGSKLYLRGCTFSNANTITGFTGTVSQNI